MTGSPVGPGSALLRLAVTRLQPLLADLVFVGGQVAELLITDPAAVRIRPTDDIDVVTRAVTRGQYFELGQELRKLGFREDTSPGAPLCRWHTEDGIRLDVMPVAGKILGFSNRWYERAIERPLEVQLEGLPVRVVSAPVFLATKWEAFEGRGGEDYFGSHDLEDILTLVAGRPELPEELRNAPGDVREWVAGRFRDFLGLALSDDVIAGALPDARQAPDLIPRVRDRIAGMARLGHEPD